MKTFNIAVLCILISSCSSPESSGDQVEETPIETDSLLDEDVVPSPQPTERDFDFSEMPRMWWRLTKSGDEFIRYNHWDAQDETIEFVVGKDGSDWMNIGYAHDSDQGDITEFNAKSYEENENSRVDGSFIYHSTLEETATKINFYWNVTEHYIEFENLSDVRLYYVDDESRGYFLYEETFRDEN